MSLPISTSPEETARLSHQIFDLVRLGESGIAVCYPGCNHEYITNAVLAQPVLLRQLLGRYYKRYFFLPVTATPEDTADTFLARITDLVRSRHISLPQPLPFRVLTDKLVDLGFQPYIFVYQAHRLPAGQLAGILAMIHDVILETNTVGAQVYFEANIYADPILTIVRRNHKFLSNINTRPVYAEPEVRYFLDSVGKRYALILTDRHKKELYDEFGGNLWLQKEALRYLRTHPDAPIRDIMTHPLMAIKLRMVYDLLTPEEQSALSVLCMENSPDTPPAIRQYFEEIRLIQSNGSTYRLTIPALTDLVTRSYQERKLTQKPDGTLWYGDTHLTPLLTPSEQAVLGLGITNPGRIITREAVAEAVWGNGWEEQYSDWAIDKLVSRLRSRLSQAGLSGTILQTVKRQGFVLGQLHVQGK